jgi:hypothetical protein
MYEIVENAGVWVVFQGGFEVARFDEEDAAMQAVSESMREQPNDEPVAFSIRFSARG